MSTHTLSMRKFVPWIVFVLFFAVLNETVFNVSTPKIAAQYGLSSAGVSWVITVFIITFGIGAVVYGKLADLYSVRKLITAGILIYCAGSLIGFALQQWYWAVIAGRAVQGAGASAIQALVMVVVSRYFTPQDRSKLFGILTSTASFAVGIGPVIGGFVSAYAHWSLLFTLSLLTLVAIPAFNRMLPREEPVQTGTPGKVDVWGALALGVCVSALVLWCTEPAAWIYLLVSGAALVLFIWRIRAAADPFVSPDLFASKLYTSGLMVGLVLFGSVLGILFLLPLMLHNVHGLDTDRIGMILFPGAFSAVIFGTVAGRITASRGSRFVVFAGLLLLVAALLILALFADKQVWWIAAALIPMYIGFASVQTALADNMAQIIPKRRIGVGMGFYGLVSFIAGAVGTALIAQLLDRAWLQAELIPFITAPQAHAYGNLLLAFSLLVFASGLLYALSLGRGGSASPAEGEGAG